MNDNGIEQEASSLYSKLEAQNEADLQQVELLKKRIEKNTILLNALRGSLGLLNPSAKSGYGSQRDAIWNAITQIPKQRFTQNDVEAVLAKIDPNKPRNRAKIRSALWALAERQEKIKVVRKGNNTQPAEFEKCEAKNGSKPSVEKELLT